MAGAIGRHRSRPRSPATMHRPATSPRPCARRFARPSRPAMCTPTARPRSWRSGRSSCGRECPEEQRELSFDHVDLLRLAAGASSIAGDRARAEMLLLSALSELDSAADPFRYAALLSRLARIQWTLNRGAQGLETAQEALSLLPEDDQSSERAGLIAWLARTQHLRGRYRDALRDGNAGARRGEGSRRSLFGGRGPQHAGDDPRRARQRRRGRRRTARSGGDRRGDERRGQRRVRVRESRRHPELGGAHARGAGRSAGGARGDAAPPDPQPRLDDADRLGVGVRAGRLGDRAHAPRTGAGAGGGHRADVPAAPRGRAMPRHRRRRTRRPAPRRGRATRGVVSRAAVDRAAGSAAR